MPSRQVACVGLIKARDDIVRTWATEERSDPAPDSGCKTSIAILRHTFRVVLELI